MTKRTKNKITRQDILDHAENLDLEELKSLLTDLDFIVWDREERHVSSQESNY